ncbi:MAG: hypothetical protein FWC71_10275 [Defluviitaleaceae bacterium]|nr:hypothetical protein [Defluviitaleaceae bacterium]
MEKPCNFCTNLDKQNESFSERYDNEMSGTAQGTLDCASCARAYKAYKRVLDEVRNLPAPNVPIDFHARVMKVVRNEQQAARRIRTGHFMRWAGLAAACFIFAAVVWLGTPGASIGDAESGDFIGFAPAAAEVPVEIAPAIGDLDGVEFRFGDAGEIDEPDGDYYGDRSALARIGKDAYIEIDAIMLNLDGWESLVESAEWNDETVQLRAQTPRNIWGVAGAAVLLIGGLGATLMAVMAYKKP